jgi:Ser/Thr protein kinase RdoA (MazF antagonist)
MTPENVLIHYGVRAPRRVKAISVGLIHATYKVEAEDGAEFILQRMHPMLSDASLTEDYAVVTEHLAERGVIAQEVMHTTDGALTVRDDEFPDRAWRLLTFVPGTVVSVLSKAAEARACGTAVGEFHQALADLKYKFKSKLALHPYDVEKFYKAFAKTIKKFGKDPLMEPVAADVKFLLREIPKLMLPSDLPKRVVHGDLKISNFVFDETGAEVRTIIDLDTCARFSVLLELGDALRSWCGHAEDNPKNKFNAGFYRAAVTGYENGAPGFLSSREKKMLPRAIKLITLNLASRFLRDYFEDNYFGFDSKKYKTRRAANLARARGQIALYLDIKKKL